MYCVNVKIELRQETLSCIQPEGMLRFVVAAVIGVVTCILLRVFLQSGWRSGIFSSLERETTAPSDVLCACRVGIASWVGFCVVIVWLGSRFIL